MKDYSLRVEIKITANNEEEAKKRSKILINELPRMEGTNVSLWSLWSFLDKKVIDRSDK